MGQQFMIVLMISGISFHSSAQTSFQKFYGGTGGEIGISAQQTSDGGYILGGHNMENLISYMNILLVKTDANGDTLWTKTVGGINYDKLTSIRQTMDGGYIISGLTNSFGAGGTDFYLVKTDTLGNPVWSKTYGGMYAEYGNHVQQTTDGGFVIIGNSQSFSGTDSEIYLVRTDPNGNALWTRIYGGLENDYGSMVQQTIDGGFILCGTSRIFGTIRNDIMIVKTDINGDSLWTRTFGGSEDENASCIQQTTDGGYIICGGTNSFSGGLMDIYVVKLDSLGNLIWEKTYGGTGSELGQKINQTVDGGYLVLGTTESFGAGMTDAYLLKIDSNGNLVWDKTFGGANTDYGFSLHLTTDGGSVIAGATENFGSGYFDFYLIKCDFVGNSGCNEGNPATIVNITNSQLTSHAISQIVPATIETNATTIVGSHGFNTTSCTLSGTNEIANNNSFSVFPNPSGNSLTLSFEKPISDGEIRVTNTLGKNVYYLKVNHIVKKEIQIENLPSGIYVVEVIAGGTQMVKKLVKE